MSFSRRKIFLLAGLIALSSVAFSQINSLPAVTSFESDLGVWQQATDDDIDWTRYSGATPTAETGPTAASDGNYYLYIENDPDLYNPPRTAVLYSHFDFSSASMPILSFDYHMYGADVNKLSVEVSIDGGSTWTEVFKVFQEMGDQWINQRICLGDYTGQSDVIIRFVALTSENIDGNKGDIAIDNVKLVDFSLNSGTTTQVTCGGYQDGTISLVAQGGFAPYAFSITDGVTYVDTGTDTSYTFTGLSGGDYLVRIKSGECQLSLGVYTVYEPPTPDITVSDTDIVSCAYDKNGKIVVSVKGGDDPFSFSIDGGQTYVSDSIFTNLDSGKYQVLVKDSQGCLFNQGEVSIDAIYAINILSVDVVNVEGCNGEATGSITVDANGGHQPLQFSIDTGNYYQNSNYFNNLTAGDYFVVIKDAQGCYDTTDVITITEPPLLVLNSVSSTDVDGCNGDSTGTITIDASGGTQPLFYSINTGVTYYQDSSYFDSLPAGNYVIYVKDNNDCTVGPDTVIIHQPDVLLITQVTKTDIANCYGDSTGTIDIDATGGTGQYFYSIDNGQNYQLLDVFDNLPAGVYKPVVKDQKGCLATWQEVELTQPPKLLIASVAKLDVVGCYGDQTGYIQMTPAGGTAPYQYSIDSAASFQSSNEFKDLPAATYFPFVKDDKGCLADYDSIVISQPTKVEITNEQATDVRCFGAYNGTILVEAQGGTGNLYFSTNGGTDYPYKVGELIDVPAGSYDIVVRDQNFCTDTGSTLVVNEPPKLVIDTVIVTDVDGCYGDSTGTITINASGGTGPYRFSIDGGLTLQDTNFFDSLPFGTNYYPYVIDSHDCYYLAPAHTVNQPNQLYISGVAKTDVAGCYGDAAGTITIYAAGGTEPLYFSIDSGATYPQTDSNFVNLPSGWYAPAVKDAKGCKAFYPSEVFVNQPPKLIFDSLKVKNITCNGLQDGMIQIYASGGKPQLYYSIDGGTSFVPASEFYSLSAGNYNIIVKDYYDCTIDSAVSIAEPDAIVIDTVITTDVTKCYGDSTGTLKVQAYGGSGQLYYAYTPTAQATSPFTTDNYFENLPAGSYYATVKDENGCSVNSEPVKINQPPEVVLASFEKKNVTCYGDKDGKIALQAYGGTSYLAYSIDAGQNWQYGDSLFTGLGPGIYPVLVKDANDCFAEYKPQVTISEPDSLKIDTVYVADISCHGYSDGALTAIASGGVRPYKFSLDDVQYQNVNYFSGLAQGDYEVYVVDAGGCKARSDIYTVKMPPNYAEFTMSTDIGCPPLKVDFQGVYPENTVYSWDFGDGEVSAYQQPTHYYTNDLSYTANYTVTVVAKHGVCSDTAYDQVSVYPKPHLDFDVDPQRAIYPDTTIDITNNTPFYDNYHWDFGDGTSFDGVNPVYHNYSICGTYKIVVTAQNSYLCYDTAYKLVEVATAEPKANFTASRFEGCSPLDVQFYNSSSNAVSYQWDFGDGEVSNDTSVSHVFENLSSEPVAYTVKLKVFGYCGTSDVAELPIYVFGSPYVDFTVEPDTVAVDQVVGFFDHSDGGRFYLWRFGDGDSSTVREPRHSYAEKGVYDVQLIVTSENGCTDSLTKEAAVVVPGRTQVLLPTAFTPDGDGYNDFYIPKGQMIKSAEIWIYDRRSNLVFHTKNWDTEFWDGTNLNGKKLPQDVYVVKIQGVYTTGQQFVEYANVTLLR